MYIKIQLLVRHHHCTFGFKVRVAEIFLLITFAHLSVSEECGTRIFTVSDVNKTVVGEWPWFVSLFEVTIDQPKYLCGASLISDRHLLTCEFFFKENIQLIVG